MLVLCCVSVQVCEDLGIALQEQVRVYVQACYGDACLMDRLTQVLPPQAWGSIRRST